MQGDWSSTVYGGTRSDVVVQFRLRSYSLPLQVTALAKGIHGNLAPKTTFEGQLGDTSKEMVSVYVLERIPGVSYIEFVLANTHDEDSDQNHSLRANLMGDLARYVFRQTILN